MQWDFEFPEYIHGLIKNILNFNPDDIYVIKEGNLYWNVLSPKMKTFPSDVSYLFSIYEKNYESIGINIVKAYKFQKLLLEINIPAKSILEPLLSLRNRFQYSKLMESKVKDLEQRKIKYWKHIKGDGNSFFRAAYTIYLEKMIDIGRLKQFVMQIKKDSESNKLELMQEYGINFYYVLIETLNNIGNHQEPRLALFLYQNLFVRFDLGMIRYFRALILEAFKMIGDDFNDNGLPFSEYVKYQYPKIRTVKNYINECVKKMGSDVDSFMQKFLAHQLKIPIIDINLDLYVEQDFNTVFDFPNKCDILTLDQDFEQLKIDDPIYVLCMSGHYDALYLDDKANNQEFDKEVKYGLKNLALHIHGNMEHPKENHLNDIVTFSGIDSFVEKNLYYETLIERINAGMLNNFQGFVINNKTEIQCPFFNRRVKISELKLFFPNIERMLGLPESQKPYSGCPVITLPDFNPYQKVLESNIPIIPKQLFCFLCKKEPIDEKNKCSNCKKLFHSDCLINYFTEPGLDIQCPNCKDQNLKEIYKNMENEGQFKNFKQCKECHKPIKEGNSATYEFLKESYFHEQCFNSFYSSSEKLFKFIQNHLQIREYLCQDCKKLINNNKMVFLSPNVIFHQLCLFKIWENGIFKTPIPKDQKIDNRALELYQKEYLNVQICQVCKIKIIDEDDKFLLQMPEQDKTPYFCHKQCKHLSTQINFVSANEETCKICCKAFNSKDDKNRKIICTGNECHKFHDVCLYQQLRSRNASELNSFSCPLCLSIFQDFRISSFDLYIKINAKICIACKKEILFGQTPYQTLEGWCHLDCDPKKIHNLRCIICTKIQSPKLNFNYLLLANGKIIHLDCFDSNFHYIKSFMKNNMIFFSVQNYLPDPTSIKELIFQCNCCFSLDEIIQSYIQLIINNLDNNKDLELNHKCSCLNQKNTITFPNKLFFFVKERSYYNESIKAIEKNQNPINSDKFPDSKTPELIRKCFLCFEKANNNLKMYQVYKCKECFLCNKCIFKMINIYTENFIESNCSLCKVQLFEGFDEFKRMVDERIIYRKIKKN